VLSFVVNSRLQPRLSHLHRPRYIPQPRHIRLCDAKHAPVSPLECALTNRDARNPFSTLRLRAVSARRIRSYENCRVALRSPGFSNFKPSDLATHFDLSPLFSNSSALFSATGNFYGLCFHDLAHSFHHDGGVRTPLLPLHQSQNETARHRHALSAGLPRRALPQVIGHTNPQSLLHRLPPFTPNVTIWCFHDPC
jgi:hypothetical protein